MKYLILIAAVFVSQLLSANNFTDYKNHIAKDRLIVMFDKNISAEKKAEILNSSGLVTHYVHLPSPALTICFFNNFDEAQKFAPSALDVLLPGLRETGSLSVSGEESVSTSNTIFLFISDIGTNITLNLLLKYGNREAIPHTELRHEMKKALDVQWDSLAFSRTIKEVVPFLHMEMKQIEEVFPIKISEMVDSVMSEHWHKLILSAELIQYLSGPPFVSYDKYKARNARIIAVASYGARGLTNTGNHSIRNALCVTPLNALSCAIILPQVL